MSKTFYLTTPLYYVNDVPHVGHTYTTVIADAIVRYRRMCGDDVSFLTGTDEHGLKIERSARQQGIEPQELVDTYAAKFRETWERLGLGFDEFIRTTEERHYRAVAKLFRAVKKSGSVYLGQYQGNYCVGCEAYVAEGRNCPDCGRPTEFMTEDSYFFKLSAFQEKLLRFYRENPDFVVPRTRMNEVVRFVEGGLQDLSISRTSFRWGIPVPGDETHIFYVWFDALTGYISGMGYGTDDEKFETWWPVDIHLIGKDILRFHAVYWPAFLMAAGLAPPKRILSHGWWTVEGEKMSKSKGNFVTAAELSNVVQTDYFRYFLLREIPLGSDGNFSFDGLRTRVNSDLVNDLGNLSQRTLKMIRSYFGGVIPEGGSADERGRELRDFCSETAQRYRERFGDLQINKAMEAVWELISRVNKYLVVNEPWILAKDPNRRAQLGSVLYHAAEALRLIALMLGPIVPEGAASILSQLGIRRPLEDHRISSLEWAGLESGSTIGKLGHIYPRLDKKEFRVKVKNRRAPSAAAAARGAKSKRPAAAETGGQEDARIDFKEFAKVRMQVARIVSAESIPKSTRLLKLKVDLGTEVRQVVAGIAEQYSPESLPGRLVVIVTNLKPARLMGVESNGMIVAASDGGKPVLATFTEEVRLGSVLT
jgi:methionyl-tRNA synthetase